MKKVNHKEILNKYYPELEYLDKIIRNDKTLLIVKSKYGKNYMYFSNLHKKQTLTIGSAVDKTEYFKNLANEVHNNFYDYSFSIYKSHNSQIDIVCPIHGIFTQETNSHIQGHGCPKCSFKNNGEKLKICKNEELKNLPYNINLNKNFLIGKDSIIISTNYGDCKMKVYSLLSGNKPSITSAINKTKYFINQAREIHGNKYNYDLVNYKNANTLIKIQCSQHGIFEQIPSSHLNGNGCKYCSYDYSGWNHFKWVEKGNISKNFESFKVYIVKLENKNEIFYKIGKTYKKIEKRFKEIPYKVTILKVFKGDGLEMSILERNLQKQNIEFKYLPLLDFGGKYECFSQIKYNV